MKKITTIATFIALLSAGNISAQFLNIEWSGPEGFVRADGVTELLAPGTAALAQLIWSPGNLAGDALPGGGVNGDNVVLSTYVIPYNALDPYGFFGSQFFTTAFAAGSVFARVFDRGSDDTSTIVGGSAYYQAPLVVNVDQNDALVYQIYNINTGSAGIPGFQTDVLSSTVIPEPSVMALLGLGGLMLAIRRQRMAA
jgi:hypothetical protein